MNYVKRLSMLLSVVWLCLSFTVSANSKTQNPIRKHDNSEKKIALTFDDGPHKEYTPQILDVLDEYGIKATFFVIGNNCKENIDLLKREIRAGHEIGNHTYSHPHIAKIDTETLIGEIIKTEDILFELEEKRPNLFRPPEGVYSQTVSEMLEKLDYIPVLWTVDTLDWKGLDAQKIADTVTDNVFSGAIILCHDYVSGRSGTPDALKIFIPELIEQGYQFVTISELLSSK